MKEENIQHIQAIITAIELDTNRKLYFNGQEYMPFTLPEGFTMPSQEMLSQQLQQLIYLEFYCKKSSEKPSINFLENDEKRQEFVKKLSKSNKSEERWDKNWTVDEIDSRGVLSVKKGNFSRNTFAGEFIKESFSHQNTQKGENVKILVRREFDEKHGVFYFIFGETLAEDNNQALVRFYFNLTPEGSPKLIEKLSHSLNKHFIPFQFKCLNHPDLYNRHDSAVLYFDKRYFKITAALMRDIYVDLQQYFKKDCPLFTKKIADGWAFAENPPNPEDSFGTNRSKLITQGILSAYNQNLSKNDWFNEVLQQIERYNFSLEHFYLNPNSHFSYLFPTFN